MFVVLLKFSSHRDQAGKFMDGHMKWLKQGFNDGIFLLSGTIKPRLGGAIIANNTSLNELSKRVDSDPFVIEKIVTAEIVEIEPGKADQRFDFLLKG
tara:strand:+ start:21276 stop:21566 length:291 start_codon:yes stop_codon:yes gene_type:complete